MKRVYLFHLFLFFVFVYQDTALAQTKDGDLMAMSQTSNPSLPNQDSLATTQPSNDFVFKGDFRFRAEYDEDSYRRGEKDRTRFRYRMRVGFTKEFQKGFSIGTSIRTVNNNDYHTPFVTLGGTGKVFGTVQLGFEKLYLKYQNQKFWAWVGKNKYPFWKQNELLWNDNINAEGAALGVKLRGGKDLTIAPTFGYFVAQSNNKSLSNDGYLVSSQVKFKLQVNDSQSLTFNFGDLYFNGLPNVPSPDPDFFLNYNILVTSVAYDFLWKKKPISIGFDNYYNTVDYSDQDEMMEPFSNQKRGFVANLKIGKLKKKGDFNFHIYYANIEKYAVVDFLAQNDWARWDYSQYNSRAGRLSGFSGFEVRSYYQVADNMKLMFRYFNVQELIPRGTEKEYGHRIRLDFDVKF